MKNVIEFPKAKSKKAKAFKRKESRQAMIALSVVTMIMGFVLINDSVTKNERTTYLISDNSSQIQDLNRAIASAKPMNPFRDLEWEHQLAKRLGHEVVTERIPSSVGRQPTAIERFEDSALGLKYLIGRETVGKVMLIKEVNYVPSDDVRDEPIFVNPENFLESYKDLWAVPFQRVESSPAPALTAGASGVNPQKVYRLYGYNDELVGEAIFVFDHEERLLSFKLNRISVP